MHIYCERNKNTDENKNISTSPLSPTAPSSQPNHPLSDSRPSGDVDENDQGDGNKKRKEIEFHYAEEPDELLSPKLGSIQYNKQNNVEESRTLDNGTGDSIENNLEQEVEPEVVEGTDQSESMKIPIRNSESKNIKSPLTPNSAIKGMSLASVLYCV